MTKQNSAATAQESVGNVQAAPTYTKEQYLQTGLYASRRDVLSALLEDGKSYTQAEVQSLLDDFLNKAVDEQ